MKKPYSFLLFGLLSITQVALPVAELVGEQLTHAPVSTWSWKSGVYGAACAAMNFSGKLALGLGKVSYYTLWKAPCSVGSLLSSASGRYKFGLGTLGLVALYGTGKAIYNRLYTINNVEDNVNGFISLVGTSKMYDWDRTEFSTAEALNSFEQAQEKDFIEGFFAACKRGAFDIVVAPGKNLSVDDALKKIKEEMSALEREHERLNPFVDISIRLFGRVYDLFGLKKNYKQACDERGITCNDRNALDRIENELLNATREKCNDQWLVPYLLLHPNYSKAVQLSSDIKMLINRLNAIYSMCMRNKKLWGNGGNGSQFQQTINYNAQPIPVPST